MSNVDELSEEYVLKHSIPKCDVGIYFLVKMNRIVYVGQTKRGLNRIIEHIEFKRYEEKDFDSYFFLPCDPFELDVLEFSYIVKFNPKYNKSIHPTNINKISTIFKNNGLTYCKDVIKNEIYKLGIKFELFVDKAYISYRDFIKLYKHFLKNELLIKNEKKHV